MEDSEASAYGHDRALRLAVSTLHPDKTSDRDHLFMRRAHAGDIQLSASSAESLGLNPRFYGRRILSSGVDLAIAKRWLDVCEMKHGSLCNQPGLQYTDPFETEQPRGLTVINVNRLCLQALPPDSRYVALSYCWPKEPGLVNRRTIQESLYSDSVFYDADNISPTIKEAIACTKELAQDYLWVDAICITQDDPVDKMRQINQMDRIYSKAVLTIVAAAPSQNGPEGLVGFSYGSAQRRQIVRRVQGLDLMVPLGCLEDLLSRTRWDTRGWTFQEAFLSRRLLYFTEHQAYFQCSSGICCEDSVGESHHPEAFVHHSTNLWNPRNHYNADVESDFGDSFMLFSSYRSGSEAFRAYCNFVSVYLRRQLSFPDDILNALSGLLKIFERSMDTRFCWGLPLRWFDLALLWQLYGPARRRADAELSSRDSKFPSWSWTGWDTGSEPPYWLTPNEIQRLIYFWAVGEDNTAVPMYTGECGYGEIDGLEISTDDFQRANLELTLLPTGGQCTPRQLDSLKYLLSRTAVACLFLDSRWQEVEDRNLWPNGIHLKIFDSEDKWVGLILTDREWAKSQRGDCFDFMLLSRAERARVEGNHTFDEKCYEKRPWCLLNVMLLKWEGDLAERVAVGVVHEDAWKAAEPESKYVKLV
ncbi:MAG: hypothetical protein M1820_001867 [Bogoriella megaspora]|nr:MAG: hypothetical protein M1820_001867 [Bogoriella megaspora]